MEVVTLRHASTRLVEEFHSKILRSSFPPDELDTLEDLVANLTAVADGLVVSRAGEAVGGLVFESYVCGDVVLLSYLAVDPAARGHGLGGELLRLFRQRSQARFILAEIEDPQFWPTTEYSNPVARYRFWARHGCGLVPISYVQPSLRVDSQRVHDLLLIVVPLLDSDLPRIVPGQIVERFLEEYYLSAEGASPTDDPGLQDMLASCRVDSLTIVPLNDLNPPARSPK